MTPLPESPSMPTPPASTRRRPDGSAAAQRIIVALEALLAERPLHAIPVSDILDRAGVARGTFYFWFTSKYDAVVQGHRQVMVAILDDISGFLEQPDASATDLRAAIEVFVETWKAHGPILAASAEVWRSEPALRDEWAMTMQRLVDAVTERIAARREHDPRLRDVDPAALAHALIWMNERTAYMASAGFPPVAVGPALVDTLTHIWSATLFGT